MQAPDKGLLTRTPSPQALTCHSVPIADTHAPLGDHAPSPDKTTESDICLDDYIITHRNYLHFSYVNFY